MLKTYYIAKLFNKLRLSSFNKCSIHRTSKVSPGCALTKVNMGKYSYMGENSRVTDASIGSFCSIGMNCSIGGGMHPMNMVSTSPVFLHGRNIMHKNFSHHPYSLSETVKIGNDVWIGSYAYIMPGVKIEDGAVIGAHSVVTHDVSAYEIVAGAPARLIRKRFDDDEVNKLMKLKWWDMSEDRLEEIAQYFDTLEHLFSELQKGKAINENSICR